MASDYVVTPVSASNSKASKWKLSSTANTGGKKVIVSESQYV
jgi:hypothetical protein